jgi:hypothetical protein
MAESEKTARAIGKWVRSVVNTKGAHAVLGPMIPDRRNSWTRGGCCALAIALQEYLGRGTLWMVTRDKDVVHVVLELGGLYIDADGAHTASGLRRAWGSTTGVGTIRIDYLGTTADLEPFDAQRADASGVKCPDPGPLVRYFQRLHHGFRFSQRLWYAEPMARQMATRASAYPGPGLPPTAEPSAPTRVPPRPKRVDPPPPPIGKWAQGYNSQRWRTPRDVRMGLKKLGYTIDINSQAVVNSPAARLFQRNYNMLHKVYAVNLPGTLVVDGVAGKNTLNGMDRAMLFASSMPRSWVYYVKKHGQP